MTDLLSLLHVGVDRGTRQTLLDVSWTVAAGDRWVVLGSNGAGKTTLAQVATLALRPSHGQVVLCGEDVADPDADLDDLATRVGLCSAALADQLPRHQRVVDVVLAAAYGAVLREDEAYDLADVARAEALLAQLGCRSLVERAFGTLSEGERKRVQIARALMANPEILVLDEPAAALDLGAREALLGWLRRLCADPGAPALVLITHHVEEIPVGATHALLMRAGRIVAAGPLATALTSASLTACYGFPLRLKGSAGRFTARAA